MPCNIGIVAASRSAVVRPNVVFLLDVSDGLTARDGSPTPITVEMKSMVTTLPIKASLNDFVWPETIHARPLRLLQTYIYIYIYTYRLCNTHFDCSCGPPPPL